MRLIGKRIMCGARAVVGLLGFSALGCGEATDVKEVSSPLINGTATSARPAVGFGRFPSGGAFPNGCGATLISPTTFVTAAHCIGFFPEQTGGVITFPGIVTDAPVKRIFSQGGGATNDDIAIGRLVDPVNGITYETISAFEPLNLNYLTAVGFGCNDSTAPGCTTAGTKRYIEYLYDGSPSNFGAPGDSGGPHFQGRLNDGGGIVRIISGSSNGHDTGADAPAFRAHILAMDTALNADGVSYRAQVQGKGWMPAVQNGAVAGTTGQSLRLETIQIWSPRQGVSVCYNAYVGNVWQGEVCDGWQAGTIGQSLRMEAITIRLKNKPAGTNGIMYNAYLQGIGWQGWRMDNQMAGTTGQSRRIEAICIQLN